MRRIILDDLRRRWWIWGLVGLACLVCGLCVDASKNLFYGAFYPVILGTAVLGLQLRGGRVLLTLPFTARQIGRTVWALIVLIPSLLLALFTGPGIFLGRHFDISTDPTILPAGFLTSWFQLTVVGSLGFGSVFWLFTRIPLIREQRNNLRMQLYGSPLLIAIIGGGYLLARSAISDEIKFMIICFLGFFFTVRGWFRSERMVIDLSTYRNDIAGAGKPKEMFKPRAGYGGIWYLIINCCVRYIAMTVFLAAITAIVLGIFFLANPKDPGQPRLSDLIDVMKGAPFYFVFFSFWLVLPIAVHQKFLRSLPLTSKELAAIILCLPIVPFLVLCGFLGLFDTQIFGMTAAVSLVRGELLYLPPICVFATALVWNSEKKFLRFIISLIVFGLSIIPVIYHLAWTAGKGLPLWIIIAYPLVSCLLALYLINRLLTRNDMAYRAQMHTFISPETPMW
jgi:hypothetical protein